MPPSPDSADAHLQPPIACGRNHPYVSRQVLSRHYVPTVLSRSYRPVLNASREARRCKIFTSPSPSSEWWRGWSCEANLPHSKKGRPPSWWNCKRQKNASYRGAAACMLVKMRKTFVGRNWRSACGSLCGRSVKNTSGVVGLTDLPRYFPRQLVTLTTVTIAK